MSCSKCHLCDQLQEQLEKVTADRNHWRQRYDAARYDAIQDDAIKILADRIDDLAKRIG